MVCVSPCQECRLNPPWGQSSIQSRLLLRLILNHINNNNNSSPSALRCTLFVSHRYLGLTLNALKACDASPTDVATESKVPHPVNVDVVAHGIRMKAARVLPMYKTSVSSCRW